MGEILGLLRRAGGEGGSGGGRGEKIYASALQGRSRVGPG